MNGIVDEIRWSQIGLNDSLQYMSSKCFEHCFRLDCIWFIFDKTLFPLMSWGFPQKVSNVDDSVKYQNFDLNNIYLNIRMNCMRFILMIIYWQKCLFYMMNLLNSAILSTNQYRLEIKSNQRLINLNWSEITSLVSLCSNLSKPISPFEVFFCQTIRLSLAGIFALLQKTDRNESSNELPFYRLYNSYDPS